MKKKPIVLLVFSLLFVVLGIALMIAGIIIEKSFSLYAILGLVLAIIGVVVFLFTFFVSKETDPVNEAKVDENSIAICPHRGANNPSKNPYCTKCGCRLK